MTYLFIYLSTYRLSTPYPNKQPLAVGPTVWETLLVKSRPPARVTMTSLIIMPLEGNDGCIIIIYDPDGIGTVIHLTTQYQQH